MRAGTAAAGTEQLLPPYLAEAGTPPPLGLNHRTLLPVPKEGTVDPLDPCLFNTALRSPPAPKKKSSGRHNLRERTEKLE